MADEVTSGEVRTRQFDVVRKGYDRNQVESFLALVARYIDTFEAQLSEAGEDRILVGLDDPEALAKELKTIGGEVAAILEAARSAAEGMRSRSAEDAGEWKAEAEADAAKTLSDATQQAQVMRDASWVEGTAMLESAIAEAGLIADETETDSLRIRAEAEREAIRYTGDAKRASEETIGAAENEADAIVARARSESESILAVANQSAELAQERVRALEDEHADLLEEIESARSSIGDLGTEDESSRYDLEEPLSPALDDTRSHHGNDGGSVRIVSGSKVVPLKPVDADSFVAEVAALHKAEDRAETSHQPAAHAVADLPPNEPPTETAVPVQPVVVEVETVPDSVPVPDSVKPTPTEAEPPASGEVGRERSEEAAPEVVRPEVDRIGSLFAQLRAGSDQPEEEAPGMPVTPDPAVAGLISGEEDGKRSDVVVAISDDDGAQDPAKPLETVGEDPPVDSLIPVQNAALRSIKRVLVDLQNDTLEHLRTDKDWVPQEDYTDRFGETFAELASAITGDSNDGGAASAFATDLYDSVSTSVVSSRAAGSGGRAIASAASKVFRTWRSDEAERRVVAVAAELAAGQAEA